MSLLTSAATKSEFLGHYDRLWIRSAWRLDQSRSEAVVSPAWCFLNFGIAQRLLRLIRRVKRVLESDQIFTGLERIEHGLFGFELFLRVIRSLD